MEKKRIEEQVHYHIETRYFFFYFKIIFIFLIPHIMTLNTSKLRQNIFFFVETKYFDKS